MQTYATKSQLTNQQLVEALKVVISSPLPKHVSQQHILNE